MRRKGSPAPQTGVGIVLAKEAADYLSGARMWLLEALVFLTAIGAAYAAILSIRATIGESPFLFLRLFTMAQDPLPSFISLLGFLIPLVAIAIGFDAINGEFSRRTMSRVLAQPIYRDALLLGKFLAGLLALAIGLVSLWLLVIGLGLLLLGLPPSGEETVRMARLFCRRRSPMAGYGWRWRCCSRWCFARPPPPPSPPSACGCCLRCSGRC